MKCINARISMLLFWQRQENTSMLVPAMEVRFLLTWFFLGMELLFYLLLLNRGVRLLCEAEQMLLWHPKFTVCHNVGDVDS